MAGVSHTVYGYGTGLPKNALIDRGSRALERGAVLLLCSDGVESLDHRHIVLASSKTAQAIVDSVLAVGAPHQDNVTVIKLEREE